MKLPAFDWLIGWAPGGSRPRNRANPHRMSGLERLTKGDMVTLIGEPLLHGSWKHLN